MNCSATDIGAFCYLSQSLNYVGRFEVNASIGMNGSCCSDSFYVYCYPTANFGGVIQLLNSTFNL
jgi:hypothetical protein